MSLRHPASILPRARALTDLVVAPTETPERLDPGLRRVLSTKIATKAPARHLGSLRLDSYTALEPRRGATGAAHRPFAWSPHTARRILGAPAARRVVVGMASSPLTAVRAEIDDVIQRSGSAHLRPGSLGSWLAEAPLGVLAAVAAAACAYATDLVSLLEFDRLESSARVGAADPIWAVPGAPWVSLRARRDIEVTLDAELRTRALVALRPGRPNGLAVDDLGLVALVDALSRPDAPLPTRVVGLWPSSGKAASLEVTPETIRRAARLVVEAVELRRTSAVAQQVA